MLIRKKGQLQCSRPKVQVSGSRYRLPGEFSIAINDPFAGK